jgi:hypothetical protein
MQEVGEESQWRVCRGRNKEYHQLEKEQDKIGWRCFMEGMICKQARLIQSLHHYSVRTKVALEKWAKGLV